MCQSNARTLDSLGLTPSAKELGAGPQTRWPSFSIAKSFSSTLVGTALHQGLISSLDDPLTRYVPQLKGGAYEGVSIRLWKLRGS